MSDITIEQIAEVVRVELEPVKVELAEVKAIVSRHSEILDQHSAVLTDLLSERKTKTDESLIASHRLDRLENWGQKVGKKLDIKLEV